MTFLLLLSLFLQAAVSSPPAHLLSVKKLWDQAPHSAFTDLLRFQNRWYCVFREGEAHADGAGKIRVLTSNDGERWESAAVLETAGRDLRDPKIVPTSDGRLMILGGATNVAARSTDLYSFVSFSRNGKDWSTPQRVTIDGKENQWLWRVVWHKGVAYGVAYTAEPPQTPPQHRKMWAWVCRSRDGIRYERISPDFVESNEAALSFGADGVLTVVLRSNAQPSQALLAEARAPYTNWTSKPLRSENWDSQLGGPQILRLPDGRLLAAGRLYKDKMTRTGLVLIDPASGTMTEMLVLPSKGDNSYPGLVWSGNKLWLSYYSSHEGKSAIYLAQIDLPTRGKPGPAKK
ncbi:MAG: exo-alpha-sialidase [Acidobacteria bacterium]|nr:exo-alpha-sialidase [Acidobacteriota bacterium]